MASPVQILEPNDAGEKPMGANSTQAIAIVFLLIGFVLLAGAFAGGGILLALGAVVLLGASAIFFKKCKPGSTRMISCVASYFGREQMIIAGVLITLLGFLISVASLGAISSVGGRMVVVFVGLGISLLGIIGVLNRAFLAKAIWRK